MKEERQLIMLPGPTNVPDRVMRAMMKPIINHRGPEFEALYDSIMENLKYVFQTENEALVLTSSGTGSIECAVSNVVNSGDKVVVPVFGVFSERLKEKVVCRGAKIIEVPIEWGDAPTAEQIEQVIKREGDVKAVALVYNETSTGATVRDLPKIGEITEENNVLLIVDAVSILGGDRLQVDDWNIDICVAGSQKCLACPPGVAVVSVSDKAWEAIERNNTRPYYFDLIKARELSAKKATPFTPALPVFYALDEALRIIREEGLENRFKRHATCAEAFYNGFEALKLTPYPKNNVRSNTVIAINVPSGVDGDRVKQIMRERYKVIITGGMGKLEELVFRIGCMGIISEAETLATINAFENTLADLDFPVDFGAGIEAARRVFHS
ncbi:MAG: pyridoxal-phosphate-dependent aminotransferase family protein [Candidatus Bathyarchaeia archaeon]